MKKTSFLSLVLLGALAAMASSGPIPPGPIGNFVNNSAAPQNAQLNVGTATVRGQMTAGSLVVPAINVATATATQHIGGGIGLTNINPAEVKSGTIPATVVWHGAVIAPQYGGIGQDWSGVAQGRVPYFSGTGIMGTVPAGVAGQVLQSGGPAGAPSFTGAPTILGTNVTAIPPTNLAAGTLPVNVPASSITASGVTPGIYGGPDQYTQVHIGSDGRITSAVQGNISSGYARLNSTQTLTGTNTFTLPIVGSVTGHAAATLARAEAIAVSTGALQVQANAIAVSTGVIAADLATEVSDRMIADAALAVSTGALQIQANAIAVSTGATQAQLNLVVVSTGALQAQADAIAVSTGSLFNTKVAKAGDTMTGGLTSSSWANFTSSVTAGAGFYGNGSGLTSLTPPGSDKEVVFNDGGAFGSHTGMTYNKGITSLGIGGAPGAYSLMAYGGIYAPAGNIIAANTVGAGNFSTNNYYRVYSAPTLYAFMGLDGTTGRVSAYDGASASTMTGLGVWSPNFYGAFPRVDLALSTAAYVNKANTFTANQTVASTFTVTGSDFSVGGSTLVVANGRVGVGKSPDYPLNVYKVVSDYLGFFDNGTVQSGIYLDSSASYFGTKTNHPIGLFTNNGTAGLWLTSANNVGINTTSPLSKLHVVGDQIVTGAFTALSSMTVTGDGLTLLKGATQYLLSGRGDTSFPVPYLTPTNTNVIAFDIMPHGSNDDYSTGLGPAWMDILDRDLNVDNTIYEALRLTKLKNGNGHVYVSYGGTGTAQRDLALMAYGGKVAVGAPTAKLKLDVQALTADNGLPATTGTTPKGFMAVGSDYGITLYQGALDGAPYTYWMQSSFAPDLSLFLPLSLNPRGGNVGIGTTAPGAKLHVSSGTILVDGLAAMLQVTKGEGSSVTGYAIKVSSGNAEHIFGVHNDGHLSMGGYPATLGTCTNGTIVTNSHDNAGGATFAGANSSCAFVFGHTYDAVPFCVVTLQTASPGPMPVLSALSATGFTVVPNAGAFASGDRLNFICMGAHE